MKIQNRRIMVFLIILIFLLGASYNISNYLLYKKYSSISGINDDIAELKNLTQDIPEINQKLIELDDKIKFLNGVCFNQK